MEILIEAIGEFILEILFDASKSKKVPLWIRIPILILLILLYLLIVGICLVIGIKSLKTNILFGIFFILISLVILVGALIAIFKKSK